MIDDEARVSLDFLALDAQFNGNAIIVYQGFIFRYVIEGGEMDTDGVPHSYAEGRHKNMAEAYPFDLKKN